MKYKRNEYIIKKELKEQKLRNAQRDKIKNAIGNVLVDFKMASTHNRLYEYRLMVLDGNKGVMKTKVRDLMKKFEELQVKLLDEKNTFHFYRYSQYEYGLDPGAKLKSYETKEMRRHFIERCEEITTAIMELTFKFEEE